MKLPKPTDDNNTIKVDNYDKNDKGRRHNKKTGKFGTKSQMGGVRKETKKSQIQIQIRTFENRWVGVLNFSKMSQL